MIHCSVPAGRPWVVPPSPCVEGWLKETSQKVSALGRRLSVPPQITVPLSAPASFEQSLVSYEDFSADPAAVLANPNLVVRIEGKYVASLLPTGKPPACITFIGQH